MNEDRAERVEERINQIFALAREMNGSLKVIASKTEDVVQAVRLQNRVLCLGLPPEARREVEKLAEEMRRE